MLPLRDANPTRHTPYVTITLIVINVLVFLFEFVLDLNGTLGAFIGRWGFRPATLQSDPLVAGVTIFSGMFLHGGWLHLGGNMLYLWIFGDNVEDRLGGVRFIIFYLLTGVLATLAQWAIEPNSIIPVIGASGAISGVLGAYLLLYPRAQITTAIFVVIFYTVRKLPAVLVLAGYFVIQLFQGTLSLQEAGASGGGVAFFAHLGGFAAGFLLVKLFEIGRDSPNHILRG